MLLPAKLNTRIVTLPQGPASYRAAAPLHSGHCRACPARAYSYMLMKHIDFETVDASVVKQAQAAKDAGTAVNGVTAVELPTRAPFKSSYGSTSTTTTLKSFDMPREGSPHSMRSREGPQVV